MLTLISDLQCLLFRNLTKTNKEREVKVNNFISELRRKGKIQNTGSDSKPVLLLVHYCCRAISLDLKHCNYFMVYVKS